MRQLRASLLPHNRHGAEDEDMGMQAYTWFLGIHQTCVVGGIAGYGLMISAFVVAAPAPGLANVVGPFGMLMAWYCLYFGVLNRDCAEVAANRMVHLP